MSVSLDLGPETNNLRVSPGTFKDRTVLITGGAGTLGKPISIAFARAGAKVLINDSGVSPHHSTSGPNPAKLLASQLTSDGYSAHASTLDITNAANAKAVVEIAASYFGTGRIDIVVNCIGIHPFHPLAEQTPSVVLSTLTTNVVAPMSIIHAAWPYFQAQRYGRVVNFTSDAVYGMMNSLAYVASKGAILGVTKTLALEAKSLGAEGEFDVKINAVAPVAYPPMVPSAFSVLPLEQQEWFKSTFGAERNVGLVLALASEECRVSGEVFEGGGGAVGKLVVGTTKGVNVEGNGREEDRKIGVEDWLKSVDELVGEEREKGQTVQVYLPSNVGNFLEFKTGYL